MNQRKIILSLFIITILSSFISFIVVGDNLDFCVKNDISNDDCVDLMDNIGQPIFWSFLSLLLITPILFFVRRETFLAWAKFASVSFPLILVVLLYMYNNEPVTGSWISGPTDDMIATFFLSPLFVITSLIIIAVKSWKLRKLRQTPF